MFLLFTAVSVIICSVRAISFPVQTIVSNATRPSPSGATPTGCAHQCQRGRNEIASFYWMQKPIATTIVAETILLVFNNRTNSTRTSTIFNTEFDRDEFVPPTNTNSAGTITTAVTLDFASTTLTRFIAFPTTAYGDYTSTYSLCGILPTSISGVATCLTYRDGCDVPDGITTPQFQGLFGHDTTTINSRAPTFTYPSHPPVPESLPGYVYDFDFKEVPIDTIEDVRGWGFEAVAFPSCDDAEVLEPLFPDLGLWSCSGPPEPCPPGAPPVKSTALLLTATSTSTETGTSIPAHSDIATLFTGIVLQPAVKDPASKLIPPTTSDDDSESTNAVPSAATSSINPYITVKSSSSRVGPTFRVPDLPGNLPTVIIQPPAVNTDGQANPSPSTTPPTKAQLVTVITGSTNAEGKLVSSTSTAIAISFLMTSTNAQGQKTASTGFSTVPITAFLPSVVSTTNAQGALVSSTYYQPVIVLSLTNAKGIQVPPTSPIIPAGAPSSPNTQIFQSFATPSPTPAITAPRALTIGTHIITANPQNQFTIGSKTLSPRSATTLSGTLISLALGGTEVIVGTRTQILTPQTLPAITSPAALIVGSQTFTPNAQGQYIIGSQTLNPGSAITISGTPITLASNDAYALIGSSTETLLPPTTSPPLFTIGSQTITPNAEGQYIVDGQTLTPGGVVSVGGTRVSLGLGGTDVVVGTSTEGLGGLIMGGFGPGPGAGGGAGVNGNETVLGFTGGAEPSRGRGVWMGGGLLAIGVVIVLRL